MEQPSSFPPRGAETPRAPAPQPPRQGITIAEFLEKITPYAWVTPFLVGLILLAFGLQAYVSASPVNPTSAELVAVGGNYGPAVAEGDWWRPLTNTFLHAGILHLGFNLWAFWSIGKFAERVFGNATFLVIYLLSGVGGSLASLTIHPMTVSVGASGAIFGVYGAMLAFVLQHQGVFPAEFLKSQRNSLLTFIGYNVVFSFAQPNIDIAAHGGGLVTGLCAGALLSRDLLDPKKHLARRALAALFLTVGIGMIGWRVEHRLTTLPEIRAEQDGQSSDSSSTDHRDSR